MFNEPNPDIACHIPPNENACRNPSAHIERRYTSPFPSTASRRISFRSRGSLRGAFVIPGDRRCLTVESHIENDVALVLLSQYGLVRLDDQPPPVPIVHPDGRPGQHTFDFRAHFADGRRVLIAIKDEDHAIKHDVVGFLRHIAPQIPTSIAHGVMLYTERSFSPSMKSNARLIQAVRRDPPHRADRAILDLLPHVHGAVRIGDLVAATPYGASAFRAIVRMIAQRMILLCADERISHRSLVTVAHANAEIVR